MIIERSNSGLCGTVAVPGDKSISHRAVMFGALSEGITTVSGFLPGEDCLSTIDCFQSMGIRIDRQGARVEIHGAGLHGLKQPEGELYVGNSGTTIRLLLGILAGQQFSTAITGDASIQKRPMRRVVEPLRAMGAKIRGIVDDNYAPLIISPADKLTGYAYQSPVASAQVKSSVLLAGLYADGVTTVTEPAASRDHTERMLTMFGIEVRRNGLSVSVAGGGKLSGRHVDVPGDISSAAFVIVAALIVPGSDIVIRNVGVNPTRTGIIEALQAMGADITLVNMNETDSEPTADIRVCHSQLKGTTIAGDIIPRLIDEVPALAIAAAFADGQTFIRDAAELKVKESNRIAAMVDGLSRMGAMVEELPDGLAVTGGGKLAGAVIDSQGDHRIAMAFAVAGMASGGRTEIVNDECIPVSFPGFAEVMRQLGAVID